MSRTPGTNGSARAVSRAELFDVRQGGLHRDDEGAAAAVARRRRIIWSEAFGCADREAATVATATTRSGVGSTRSPGQFLSSLTEAHHSRAA